MRGIRRVVVSAVGLCLLLLAPVTDLLAQGSSASLLMRGTEERNRGQIDQSIASFSALRAEALTPSQRAAAEDELGATLVLAHRYGEAEPLLQHAYAEASVDQRARIALDLGNLAASQHQDDAARRWYQEATHSGEPTVQVSAALDLARLSTPGTRLVELRRISSQLGSVAPASMQDRLRLNLGLQAEQLGAPGLQLAYDNVSLAANDAEGARRFAIAAQGGDALAQIYEDQHRDAEALQLDRRALALAAAAAPAEVAETMVSLDWREARLLKDEGQSDDAIAAYQRAVDQIEQIRQDLPIEYEDGRSSFAATLKPIYLGLADLRLARVHLLKEDQRSEELESITDTLELLKQAEMQDYLGDRCTVDAIQQGKPRPGPGVAFIYPVVLEDRIELILETDEGLVQATVPVSEIRLDATVRELAGALRADAQDYEVPAQALYDWLLRPLQEPLRRKSISTIVMVADGVLRLVPIGVLNDGKHFVIESYASATVTGLSMTNTRAAADTAPRALIAGMSEAGPVVDALDAALRRAPKDALPAAPYSVAPTRGLLSLLMPATGASESPERASTRAGLALPGVRDEVNALQTTLHGTLLLDAQFTERHFEEDAASGDYRIVHIASHGFFGGSASDSFILTYDKLLTIDALQTLLESGAYRAHPIEILSLSACETAEGNERSPLGISGAAMKARAKSVLGTLWPVEDHAAQVAMEGFYQGIEAGHLSKAEALRQAQLELLRNAQTARPFYWAPFVLIGNWL